MRSMSMFILELPPTKMPLNHLPFVFFGGDGDLLLKRVEGFTSPSNIYIRYSQLISFMSSVSVTPPWSYTNQQVMLMDWIPICGQHLKSFGWLISCKQWIRWSCHRLQICQETYFVHILNRWYIYIYKNICKYDIEIVIVIYFIY